jgi:hypothetical protein
LALRYRKNRRCREDGHPELIFMPVNSGCRIKSGMTANGKTATQSASQLSTSKMWIFAKIKKIASHSATRTTLQEQAWK